MLKHFQRDPQIAAVGGEVFLRPDFLDIYQPLTHVGLNLTLFTNGTLVKPEHVELNLAAFERGLALSRPAATTPDGRGATPPAV